MKKPNFFIIGAPKCGTTAMAEFLEKHPQIFVNYPKEISFFNTDHTLGHPMSLEKYLSLFKAVGDEKLAIGEVTTYYLYSTVAVHNILAFNPDAKFIVMLRNPVTMVTSFHAEMYWGGVEQIENFEAAWRARTAPQPETTVGYACKDASILRYQEICKLGMQVDKLLKSVARKNVLFIIMDDLQADAERECQQVLEFLGVDRHVTYKMEHTNSSKYSKSPVLKKIIWYVGQLRRWYKIPRWMTNVSHYIHQLNSRGHNHRSITPELNRELIETFREDIQLLATLLGRDFSNWLQDK